MLRMYTNTPWKEKASNVKLNKSFNELTNTIAERRMKLAGHCIRQMMK